MKPVVYSIALGTVVLLGAGCSGDSDSASSAPAPAAPSANVSMAAPAPTAPAVVPPPGQAAPAASITPAAAPTVGVTPELTPIQDAVRVFEEKNGRMPDNVEELVSSGIIKELPKLPPDKLYYIDHGTKQVKIGSNP